MNHRKVGTFVPLHREVYASLVHQLRDAGEEMTTEPDPSGGLTNRAKCSILCV
jgi:hypothetical protein